MEFKKLYKVQSGCRHMESEFREDQKQKSKDISRLSQEIFALKTTLIGIDGQNGMRSQIASLAEAINDIKNSLSNHITTIYDIKAQEARYELIFATKMEQRRSEEKIFDKMIELDKKIVADIEKREKEKVEQEKYLEGRVISKRAFTLSLISVLITIILGFFIK